MKLIEKLAREECLVNPADEIRDEDSAIAVASYILGFRKARGMASKEAEELANPNSLVDDGFGEYIAEQIRKLGEEEV